MSETARSLDPTRKEAAARPSPENEDWDDVSQASWESFPASDPPAWISRPRRDPKARSRATLDTGSPYET